MTKKQTDAIGLLLKAMQEYFDSEEQTAWLKDTKTYTDLADGTESDAGAVRVPAGSYRWLLHEFS